MTIVLLWLCLLVFCAILGCLYSLWEMLRRIETMLTCDCPDDPPQPATQVPTVPQFLALQHLDRSMTRH